MGKIIRNGIDYSFTSDKNILTARVGTTTSDTAYSTVSYLPLGSIACQIGSKLSLRSNSIIIGEGVKKVKVSGAIFGSPNGGSVYVWLKIRKNGYDIAGASAIANIANSYGSATVPPVVVEVAEGDAIRLYNDAVNTKIRHSDSHLTVEVVE